MTFDKNSHPLSSAGTLLHHVADLIKFIEWKRYNPAQ